MSPQQSRDVLFGSLETCDWSEIVNPSPLLVDLDHSGSPKQSTPYSASIQNASDLLTCPKLFGSFKPQSIIGADSCL